MTTRSPFRFGVRTKLFLASVSVIAIAVVVAYAYLSNVLDRMLTERIRDDLFVRLEMVERQAEHLPLNATIGEWDALADDLGAHSHARVTFIAGDGSVLGDSEVPVDRIAQIENHAERPEVMQAKSAGRGSSARLSDTVHERLLYVAEPMKNGGFARVALPLVEVEHAEAQLRRALFMGTLLALALAVAMSFLTAQFSSRAVGHLTNVANAMAKGDFDARARLGGADEFAELGRALDQLADSLSVTVRQLRAERDRVGRILSGMQEGVLLLDTGGRIALVNPALRQMLLLGADCVGKTPFEVIQNEELEKLVEGAQSTSATQAAELDLAGIKPRRVLVRVVPLAGEPGGLLAVFVDVTNIRRLESMRRDFVANASHELRTPVTAVRSAAETLRFAMASDPDSASHFLDIIERNAERLQRLVEDLLDLSRIESREFRLTFEDEPVGELVGQVIGLFRERSEKKRIRLSADIPADIPNAHVDARAFEQVLTNLVDNALKYSPERASVVVRARPEERKGRKVIRVSVIDTGPGIEERHLPRLFERFYRVDTGRSRELGGTGLGLSIVKHLCEALGGAIEVESAVGKGSTFSFTLPQARGEEHSVSTPTPPP
jgi:two-component system, OmpR family, phosphate regulon sensor histidine kinase PhoR